MKNHEFAKDYGVDLLEEIFEVFIGDRESNRVSIHSVVQHDPINHSFMATIYDNENNELCEVYCRNGNWGGSEILDYGDISTPKRYASQYYLGISRSIIDPEKLKFAEKVFASWKGQDWFKEMENKINYDFHVCAATKTRKYWEAKAEDKGLEIFSRRVEVEL